MSSYKHPLRSPNPIAWGKRNEMPESSAQKCFECGGYRELDTQSGRWEIAHRPGCPAPREDSGSRR